MFLFVCLFGGGDEDGVIPLTYIINYGAKPLSGSCEREGERERKIIHSLGAVCVCVLASLVVSSVATAESECVDR